MPITTRLPSLQLSIPSKDFKRIFRMALTANQGVLLGHEFDVYEFDTFGVFRMRVVSGGHETDVDFYKMTGTYRIWVDGVLVAPELN